MTQQRGFTLVELMITVSIIALLMAVAVPTYQAQVQRTQQTRAQGDMMDALGAAERYRAQQLSYAGFALPASLAASDRYNFQLQLQNNDQVAVITALPINGQAGAGAMAVDSQGRTCLNTADDSACNIGTDPVWK